MYRQPRTWQPWSRPSNINVEHRRPKQKPEKGWIRQLQVKQEANRIKAKDKYQNNLDFHEPILPGPIDTIVIGDSIVKYVDQIRHTQVFSFPGIKCSELERLIVRNKIKAIEGKSVIMIHCGTNDLNQHWLSTVYEITHLIVAIADKYPNAKIVLSTILPRPARTENYNEEEVRRNIISINNALKRRQRHLNFTTVPSHTSFHKSKHPLQRLFARDYLHLKPKGTLLLRELYRQHLIRLRTIWGMRTWPVHQIQDPETIINRQWLAMLCNDTS